MREQQIAIVDCQRLHPRTGKWTESTFSASSLGRARTEARERACPFRAPHHTVSVAGILSELALAAGGVLYLDEADCFHTSTLRYLLGSWQRMTDATRPMVYLARGDAGPSRIDALRAFAVGEVDW